jgi:hypothetical protein
VADFLFKHYILLKSYVIIDLSLPTSVKTLQMEVISPNPGDYYAAMNGA